MKHVLLATSYYPSKEAPHRAVFVRDLAQGLARSGIRVGVLWLPELKPRHLISGKRSLPRELRLDIREEEGYPVYRVLGNLPLERPALCESLSSKYGLAAFNRYCADRGRPQVIHAQFTLYGGVFAAALKAAMGLPFLLTEHYSGFINGNIPESLAPTIKRVFNAADKLISVGPKLTQAMAAFAPERTIDTLGNPVNEDLFTPPANGPGMAPFRLAVACNLYENKGLGLLLEAFKMAFPRGDARLTIAGSGPLFGELKSKIETLGLGSLVILAGSLDRHGIRNLFQNSHGVVSASHTETFGITLIEAMACGIPVVATRSGGPDWFLNRDRGFLVPVGDRSRLAQALVNLRENYHQFDSHSLREGVLAEFGGKGLFVSLE